jgi:CubicO group peptidase (beta-lactamase class C family)
MTPQPQSAAARFDAFCNVLEEARQQYGVPGVGVGVLHAGQEFTTGLGVTNLNHPLPVDSDTLFQIGSTSKTFTATVAMQLVEMGKLDLDKPIKAYLPDFQLQDADATAKATLRHLFTHTGGWIGDFFIDPGRGDDALQRYVARMGEVRQEFSLGDAYAYNNAGFALAGLIIQEVCGKTYEQVVKEMLLEPLGMEMSFFFPEEAIVHRTAVGHYTPEEGAAQVSFPWILPRAINPVGGITSSARDQLRYARFHLGDGTTPAGKQLMQEKTVRLMQQGKINAASTAQEVGISWLTRYPAGLRMVGHGGATHNQFSVFDMIPERNFAFTLMTNGSRGRSFNSAMTKKALDIFLDTPVPAPTVHKLPPAELAAFAGRYRATLIEAEVTAGDEGLIIVQHSLGGFPDESTPPAPPSPPCPFVFTGTDQIEALEGSLQGVKGIFARNADGSIRWLHMGGRIHHPVE